MSDPLPHTDEHWLAMAALDHYPIEDGLPKSTSVVYRIHQLGHQRDELLTALKVAAPHVCSLLCPSVKREDESWLHSVECRAVTDAIAKAEGPVKAAPEGEG